MRSAAKMAKKLARQEEFRRKKMERRARERADRAAKEAASVAT